MDQNAKQLIAEKLRSSGSVLVTVSKNPSVDQLASAIGLSLMLNALNKHAAAVFSGDVPNTMQFLDADRRFDSTVDGLRDFIITLSKDKADKLRYKVEDEVVKIFITPYQGKITEEDLDFSQGDFNVDVVVALGVEKRDDLDNAITAHGRILHDAAIMTITAGAGQPGELGTVNWHDPNASSISEMLVSISEALQGNLLDAPMATAFLTGIVAATDRFSNEKTSPKVMTMAAQLMAAGANQQLIATNLNLPETPNSKNGTLGGTAKDNQTLDIHKDDGPKETKDKPDELPRTEDGKLDADKMSLVQIEEELHAHEEQREEDKKEAKGEEKPQEQPDNEDKTPKRHDEDPAIEKLEEEIDSADASKPVMPPPPTSEQPVSPPPPPAPPPSQSDKRTFLDEQSPNDKPTEGSVPQKNDSYATAHASDIAPPPQTQQQPAPPPPPARPIGKAKGQGPRDGNSDHPSMGGTFNATSEQAHEESEAQRQANVNSELLQHGNRQQAMSQQPSPEDMINQARQEVESAMQAGYSGAANNPLESVGSQPMATDGDFAGQLHQQGPPPLTQPPVPPPQNNQAPMVPPPMPPGAQAPSPNAPPPPSNTAPPPMGPPPNNGVGQTFIPPNQPQQNVNPYNQPNSQDPYQQ